LLLLVVMTTTIRSVTAAPVGAQFGIQDSDDDERVLTDKRDTDDDDDDVEDVRKQNQMDVDEEKIKRGRLRAVTKRGILILLNCTCF